jgi:hypothetical protein
MSDWLASVRVATTANIILSGEKTIDGVAIVEGDAVLVKDQTNRTENGIYICRKLSRWHRRQDMNVPNPPSAGAVVTIEEGATQGGRSYRVATPDPVAIGSQIEFEIHADPEIPDALQGLLEGATKNNFNALEYPTTEDDETEGYAIGSQWMGPGGDLYICTSAEQGAAQWAPVVTRNTLGLHYGSLGFLAMRTSWIDIAWNDLLLTPGNEASIIVAWTGAGTILDRFVIDIPQQWGGGDINEVLVKLGVAGNLDVFLTATDIITLPGGSRAVFDMGKLSLPENQEILLTIMTSGSGNADLEHLEHGAIRITNVYDMIAMPPIVPPPEPEP